MTPPLRPEMIETVRALRDDLRILSSGELTRDGYLLVPQFVKAEKMHATVDALDALLAAVTWRPIESAPKDGTNVLLRVGKVDAGFVGMAVQIGRWVPGDPIIRKGPRGRSMWRYQRSASANFDECHQPTHWLPLPSPPARSAEETR